MIPIFPTRALSALLHSGAVAVLACAGCAALALGARAQAPAGTPDATADPRSAAYGPLQATSLAAMPRDGRPVRVVCPGDPRALAAGATITDDAVLFHVRAVDVPPVLDLRSPDL